MMSRKGYLSLSAMMLRKPEYRLVSAGDTVVYHATNSKSIEALKGLDFPGQYAGILVHGHETALYHFGTDHAECKEQAENGGRFQEKKRS